MKLEQKKLWPLLVVTGALLASTALVALKPDPTPRAIEAVLPVVDIVVAEPAAQRVSVRAQGTLAPRDEVDLVAEVAGRVEWISPSFDGAGEFAKDEPLVRLARADYEIATQRARAAVARAESQLDLARAAQSRSDALFEAGAASPAAYEQARGNALVAEANLRDAEASLAQAELALSRTQIRAPFAGRVRERKVALGQYLAPSAPVARIYGGSGAEVKLSLRADDAAFLELPSDTSELGPRAILRASVAGEARELSGRIVASTGALDPRTRMLGVTVRLDDPTAASAAEALGSFAEVEIEGRELASAVKLPRAALSGDGSVFVVGEGDVLEARAVEVARADEVAAWVTGGLRAGERVCAHAPSSLAVGTRVRIDPGSLARTR
jgi:RND family efflux transporter MFP subunit